MQTELVKTTITIIYPDKPLASLQRDLPEEPGYMALRDIVEPILKSDMERVNVFHNGKYTDMFVDELGKLRGLPVNDEATKIYRNNVLTHVPGTDPATLDKIYGIAILFDRKVWF